MEQHPTDKVPENVTGYNKFMFDVAAVPAARRECQLQLDALEERLRRITEHFKVCNGQFTLIDRITQITQDPAELRGLAKGLERVADDIIGPLTQLRERVQILDLAEKDPRWFSWAFGDFSDEVDKALKDFEDLDQLLGE
jgi:hypothetical protein